MELEVISTGSKGNAYILRNEDEALLIECGVNINQIKAALAFNFSKITGCIVTHEHQDHAKSINEIMKLGIEVYATKGTLDKCKATNSHRANIISSKQLYEVGGFRVMPFDVKHDAAEPVGFLIHHDECGNVLFLTDTFYSKYRFPGLNNIIIEANYSKSIIDQKYGAESEMYFLRNRILKSHMSLDNCLKLLASNNIADSAVKNIVLIHLSDSNSHEEKFKEAVQA
jgi:phosphoribosyl 1,2-cyclic phosphodiesterase